ncbi:MULTISPECIES: ECF-type sigma factor [Dyella]|uniref:Sigma-70 family RNA polymerase sigma factor n=2 Tax=Dyella TaxID=231454 RepID=A0A4R0YYP9_9GAMM|nr:MULTISPECIES: ECF-type sigma factor [Dyella]TBR39900.1 sigma-70 family RNA polymerase sigma factor [Dyella terrae]TCI12519.1 sigma-70 family RNA polymerase sigma factor [Dyella soli]
MDDLVEVTQLLHHAKAGDAQAMDDALREMYVALHGVAMDQLRQNRSERTLSATALVNEAYLKVFGTQQAPELESRGHLIGVVARAMRQVLIDAARRRKAAKRPQADDRLNLTDIAASLAGDVEPDALDDALDRLGQLDPRQARIVEMRFFVGLSAEQIASALDISPSTVQREWRVARAWLQRELIE